MVKTNEQLPYFNALLELFSQGDADALLAFGRHVHWGYWDAPSEADGSVTDFANAAENLCRRVCDAGLIKNGLRILDTGCGFGGTIASLNERFSNLDLVGLNIDERQLERAIQEVQAINGNKIEFIQGDACELPFDDASFDVVLAVECIFHFPSRDRYFQEVKRVLRPGGYLALSDFVLVEAIQPLWSLLSNIFSRSVLASLGQSSFSYTFSNYRTLAKTVEFTPFREEDITVNTIPTYPVVCKLLKGIGSRSQEQFGSQAWITDRVIAALEWLSSVGFVRYMILSYQAK